ncbi:hypothetical protein CFP56_002379, partial [Quercus suber]
DSNIQFIQKAHSNVKIEYFTDLIRTFQLPPPENLPKRGNDWAGLSYTATQLHEAGVKFEATLRRQYFSTPWRAASIVAAIILLVLTFNKQHVLSSSSNVA